MKKGNVGGFFFLLGEKKGLGEKIKAETPYRPGLIIET